MTAVVYLGLGSNLGDKEDNIETAIRLLSQNMVVKSVSSLYRTEPMGFKQQPVFINAVVSALTGLDPVALLAVVKQIEVEMGRKPGFKDGPRLIDIDILFYGDLAINSPGLAIPHERLSERAFVLVPLAEIAPDLVHPLSKKKISDLVSAVSGKQGVKKVGHLEFSPRRRM